MNQDLSTLLAAGIPTLAVIVGFVRNESAISGLAASITRLENSISARLTSLENTLGAHVETLDRDLRAKITMLHNTRYRPSEG
jgi:hypothetical protein